jgi:hypothetical protein
MYQKILDASMAGEKAVTGCITLPTVKIRASVGNANIKFQRSNLFPDILSLFRNIIKTMV